MDETGAETYSGTGLGVENIPVWTDVLDAQSIEIPLISITQEGSYCLMITVRDETGVLITVPYYFVIVK